MIKFSDIQNKNINTHITEYAYYERNYILVFLSTLCHSTDMSSLLLLCEHAYESYMLLCHWTFYRSVYICMVSHLEKSTNLVISHSKQKKWNTNERNQFIPVWILMWRTILDRCTNSLLQYGQRWRGPSWIKRCSL